MSPAPAGPVVVTRSVHFNAAHRLHNPAKSAAWNRATFGPCNHPNWHGHNYTLEVSVVGEPDPATGCVIDLGELKRIVERAIVSKCDHRNLNLDVDFLRGIIPSTENLVVAFWRELEPRIPRGRLYAIRLCETERNRAEYFGPAGPPPPGCCPSRLRASDVAERRLSSPTAPPRKTNHEEEIHAVSPPRRAGHRTEDRAAVRREVSRDAGLSRFAAGHDGSGAG